MMLHGLWIGNRPVPKENNFFDQWGEVNPACETRLWSEDEATGILFKNHPRMERVYKGMPYLVGKAGMLRFAIVEEYGGLYMDLDMECTKPFGDLLNEPLVFQQYGTMQGGAPIIADNIFGSAAHHEFWGRLFNYRLLLKGGAMNETHAALLWGILPLGQVTRRYGIDFKSQPLFGHTRHHSSQSWAGR